MGKVLTVGAKRVAIAGRVLQERRAAEYHACHTQQPEGLFLEPHRHGCTFVMLVLAGAYRETIAGKTEVCLTDTIRYLPAQELHSNEYVHGAHCLNFGISPAIAHALGSRLEGLRPGEMRGPLMRWFGVRLQREFEMADGDALGVTSTLVDMLAEALGMSSPSDLRQPSWFSRLEEFLRGSFLHGISLAAAAEAMSVHPVHLCRTFRRLKGCTLGEYVRSLKVARACELLQNSSHTISEIALLAGFSDQSHLNRVFRRRMGSTPARFRRPR